ncbi:hypothetical protein A1507_10990 [Methylomonas koyamae]|uniref:Uncharacterized protein n=1 Tax=Methylomonas koyamae TaxID=702114 RepID=A0A177NIM6_9GAMM|nr:CopG family transcriptional regulator [Methylomonas koyamae]OAI17303.1 hypothetical protein A1507_10990 [Methylomonas koyamae]
MKAGDFDRKFDDVVDISGWLDLSKAKRAEREPLCSQEHAKFIEAYNQSLQQDGLRLGKYWRFLRVVFFMCRCRDRGV